MQEKNFVLQKIKNIVNKQIYKRTEKRTQTTFVYMIIPDIIAKVRKIKGLHLVVAKKK